MAESPQRPVETSETPEAQFISISGIWVRVSDFIDLWNGKDCLPEIDDLHEHPDTGGTDIFPHDILIDRFFRRPGIDSPGRDLMRQTKRKRLLAIIGEYKAGSGDTGILSMHRVLSALSSGNMKFSDVGEFAAAWASPTHESVEQVRTAVSEVKAIAPIAETRYLDSENIKPIAESAIKANRHMIQAVLKGIREDRIPLFILEKAIFGHALSPDDLQGLSAAINIGSTPLLSLLKVLPYLISTGGMAVVAYGLTFGVELNKPEEVKFLVEKGMMAAIVGTGLQFMPLKLLLKRRKLASSNKRYEVMFNGLAKQVNELKKTACGRLQLALIEQIILAAQQEAGQNEIELLWDFIQRLGQSSEQREAFEVFCRESSSDDDWKTPDGVREIIRKFELQQVIEGEFALAEDPQPTAEHYRRVEKALRAREQI